MTYNNNPVITSSNATGSFTEDANTTGSTVDHVLTGTMNFTDKNNTDTHTTTTALKTASWSGGSTLPTGALAKFQAGMTSSILTDSNGAGQLKWTFSEDDRDFDFLAKGETLVLTYEIILTDNHGGTTKKTVKITITGTDDQPVFTATAEATLTEQAGKTLSFSHDTAHIAINFTDVDLNNTGHTACVLSVSASGNTDGLLPGSWGTAQLMSYFDIDNVVKSAGSSTGTINTTFSAPDLSFDYLADGEQLVITYVVQVDDRKGGLTNQNVVVTINGTNDGPCVIGFAECRNLTEGEDLTAGNLTASGDFHFSDIDLSDTHTISTTVTATLSSGGTVQISEADLIAAMGAALADDPNSPGNPNDSTGDLFGKVVWNFALSDSDVNFLAEGEVLTLTYHIIVTDPSGASDSEEVTIKIVGTADPTLTKIATVNGIPAGDPGGVVDSVGDIITYTITYSNDGSAPLTGVTVTDPSVSNLAAVDVDMNGFNDGDTNNNNALDVGETWQYTASHIVTQDDIDNNGTSGDGIISNTVTADSNESDPVSVTTTVDVVQNRSMAVTKTANVGSVNAAGQVINYTVTVQNTGNTSLTNLQVTDPLIAVTTPVLDPDKPILGTDPLTAPVLNGDYNAGDTDQDGFEDPGETFQYAIVGDDNGNGLQDAGEFFTFTNIGDLNQNGIGDPGEVFQYYNLGDTNQNGIEDVGDGEVFVFNVDDDLDYVSGDTNFDGKLNAGETWTFTTSYTITQAHIDNGGVYDASLALNNTATATTTNLIESASASVVIDQNPIITVVKTVTGIDDGTADEVGDVINYAIAVKNDGNMTMTNLEVEDDTATNLAAVMSGAFNSGDDDQDGVFDLNETWHYTASYTITQDDIDNGSVNNIATATTDQTTGTGSASVAVDQNPSLSVSKIATVAGGTADTAGEVINYTITVTNDGNMTLTNLVVTDPNADSIEAVETTVGINDGDTDTDGIFDVGEVWQFTATHTVTQQEIDDNGEGGVDDGFIDNTVTATTTQASGTATASVQVVQPPPPVAPLTVDDDANISMLVDVGPSGPDAGGDLIQFFFKATNHTSGTFTSFSVTDSHGDIPGTLQDPLPATLGPNGVFGTTFNHHLSALDVTNGFVDEDITVSVIDPSSTPLTVTLHLHFLL